MEWITLEKAQKAYQTLAVSLRKAAQRSSLTGLTERDVEGLLIAMLGTISFQGVLAGQLQATLEAMHDDLKNWATQWSLRTLPPQTTPANSATKAPASTGGKGSPSAPAAGTNSKGQLPSSSPGDGGSKSPCCNDVLRAASHKDCCLSHGFNSGGEKH